MDVSFQNPRLALDLWHRRQNLTRKQIDCFKENFVGLFDRLNESESEEHLKNLTRDFLQNVWYAPAYYLNTKDRSDLVLHNGPDGKTKVGVIVEVKRPANKGEMVSREKINTKAMCELLLYYLRERITQQNIELKNLVITNVYEWFIFDVQDFEKVFAQNKELVKHFNDFEAKTLSGKTTDFFYNEVAKPFLAQLTAELPCVHFNLKDYEAAARSEDPESDKTLIDLYKIFSPEYLLKVPFGSDSNTLDVDFYNELLHVAGLTEVQREGRILIVRKPPKERHAGSLLENAIARLDELDKIAELDPRDYGDSDDEKRFNAGLSLVITWINRILFLKLLEAQLIRYNKGDKEFVFLHLDKIKSFSELNTLFFKVLAAKIHERDETVKQKFENIPYLNSSLFEPTDLERAGVGINALDDGAELPIMAGTVLRERNDKPITGAKKGLAYIFEFLGAYDFGAEGRESIQEQNKKLINAAVLGLIFEKINGYKDGSFFTPGFITMYMCRETIRRAVVHKFNAVKGWNCQTLDDVYDRIEKNIEGRKEANEIFNTLKICDPAVGSGHFLVSALNELIAIKSELHILLGQEGVRLKGHEVRVQNDELLITDEDGEVQEYRPKLTDSQKMQEALFHEKQTLIEKCLFGVDINPNSVEICRLRLWIELLKHAYYTSESKYKELETLPNIDINIKTGNSLLSRFPLQGELVVKRNGNMQRIRQLIEDYKWKVEVYKHERVFAMKREIRRDVKKIKEELSIILLKEDKDWALLKKVEGELAKQPFFFNENDRDEWIKLTEFLSKETDRLRIKLAETAEKYRRGFEWRFEFPEVLDDEGNFLGFDAVIGNPPYGVKVAKFIGDILLKKHSIKNGDMDSAEYFIFKAHELARHGKGLVSLIVPKSILFANNWEDSRNFLLSNQLFLLADAGIAFEKVNLETIIFGFNNNVAHIEHIDIVRFEPLKKYDEKKVEVGLPALPKSLMLNSGYLTVTDLSNIDLRVLDKIQTRNEFISNIDRRVYRGLYIPDNLKEFILDKGETLFINKVPDVSRYTIHQIRKIDLKDRQVGEKYRIKARSLNYNRIIIKVLRGKRIAATFVTSGILTTEKLVNFIPGDINIYYALGIINSKIASFYIQKVVFSDTTETSRVLDDFYLKKIPMPRASLLIENKIESLVSEILSLKKADAGSDTAAQEKEIDRLVYDLYGLTDEERAWVEKG